MKFSFNKKTLSYLMLLLITLLLEITIQRELSADVPQFRNNKLLKQTSNFNNAFENFRFSTYKSKSKNTNKNTYTSSSNNAFSVPGNESQTIFIMNTEILDHKPNASSIDNEQEVIPRTAHAGTYYTWGFAWWSFLAFPPENSIIGRSYSYWLSKDGVNEDYIEYTFDIPTKLDSMIIEWRLPPTSFKVEFRVTDNGPLLPITNKEVKFKRIQDDGKPGSLASVWPNNGFKFNKPIFVKSIKISMWDPLKSNKFSIFKTRFFNIRSTMVIVNQTVDPCKQLCFFVNTDKPVEGTNVESIDCLSGMSTADNRELFQYYSDRSVRTYNSKHCIGFDPLAKSVILRDCPNYSPFKISTNTDNSLSFTGYEHECLYLDTSKSQSENFVTEKTEVLATSEYDRGIYKKENITINSEMFWMTVPGVVKSSLQINFGKLGGKNNWEVKKIDKIILTWSKPPIDFRVFTWYPGTSWILFTKITNNEKTTTELETEGLKASAILIELDKGKTYDDLDKKIVFALKEIYIGTNSYKIKTKECSKVPEKTKFFDFDNQFNLNTEKTSAFERDVKRFATSFDKMIALHKKVIKFQKLIPKAKETATRLNKDISDYKVNSFERFLHEAKLFEINKLKRFNNITYMEYKKKFKKNLDKVKDESSNQPPIGSSEEAPGQDCVHIKTVIKNAISGFYWIKPECNKEPLKVWCDFSIYDTAVDIYVFSDYITTPNPDISYLKIEDNVSIGYQCAKLGLKPLEIKSVDIARRTVDILQFLGYDLTLPHVVPLGFDYECKTRRGCSFEFNSFSKKNTQSINSFFEKVPGELKLPGTMAGVGFGKIKSLKIFNPRHSKITALICSTNKTRPNPNKDPKFMDCNARLNGNGDLFKPNSKRLIFCESNCLNSNNPIYGDLKYDGKSAICKAAIHMGAMGSKGGIVKIKVLGKNLDTKSYASKNGITSEKNPSIDGSLSFTFSKYVPDCPIFEFKELAKREKYELPDPSTFSSFMETSVTVEGISLKDFDGVDPQDLQSAGISISGEKAYIQGSPNFENSNPSENEEYRFSQGWPGKLKSKVDLPTNIDKQVKDLTSKSPKKAMKAGASAIKDAVSSSKNALKNMTKDLTESIKKQNQEDKEKDENKEKPEDKNEPGNNTQKDDKYIKEEQKKLHPSPDPEIIEEKVEKPDPSIDCSPNTNSGSERIEKIFDQAYRNRYKGTEKQIGAIKKDLTNYRKEFSWSQEGNELSNVDLFRLFRGTSKIMVYLKKRLQQLLLDANGRKQVTVRIHDKWLAKLIKLTQYNSFGVDKQNNIEDIFITQNLKIVPGLTDSQTPPEWKFYNTNIKSRSSAVGLIGAYKPRKGLVSSSLILKDKIVYDFTFQVDILVPAQSGSCGIQFRKKSNFSYYAFIIDLDRKSKSVYKVYMGKETLITELKDGGILANNWHSLKITAMANGFKIEFKDLESSTPAGELHFNDATFSSGDVGVFSTNIASVYFDNFKLDTNACWSPWETRSTLQVVTSTVNYYNEDFKGTLQSRYNVNDPEDAIASPSEFKFSTLPNGISFIEQSSFIADKGLNRRPAFIIHKAVNYATGTFKTKFIADTPGGTIYLIFKYLKTVNKTGESNESFYSFEFNDLGKPKGVGNYYSLRKYENGKFEVLKSVLSLSPQLMSKMSLGYIKAIPIETTIAVRDETITVLVSFDNQPVAPVLEVRDPSFLKYGGVGFGTFGAKAKLYELATAPFKITISQSMINSYIKSPALKPLSIDANNDSISNPTGSDDVSSVIKQLSSSSSSESESSTSSSSEISSTSDKNCVETGKADQVIGEFKKCLTQKTLSQREMYCHATFPHMEKHLCLKNFCTVCCEDEEPESPAKTHTCQKSCNKISQMNEEANVDYFEECWKPTNAGNSQDFCSLKYVNKRESNQCKKDFCLMCCNLRDVMFNKNHSYKAISACQQNCISNFDLGPI